MLIMRACSQTSVISFAVGVWSRHATGGKNALRDEIKQLKTKIAKKKSKAFIQAQMAHGAGAQLRFP